MGKLTGQVALVTGASRGVGKGIAIALGAEGATVYVTGRTVDPNNPTVPLTGTIHETVAEINQRGGQGIAIACDHRDDEQVKAVFDRIQAVAGRLDLLVNNAWAGYEGYTNNKHLPPWHPFWTKPISYWDENLDGVRWAYVASHFAIPMMIPQKSGMIVNISFPVPNMGNAAYGIAKQATDRLTEEIAYQTKEHNICAMTLYPGLVRTEGVIMNAQYFDMSNSESPEFTGRAVVAVTTDPNRMTRSGQHMVVAKLAIEYDFDDIDGKRPTPIEQY